MSQLIIDPEFRNYLPGVPKETDEMLQAQLIATGGPLDAFKVWKGHNILIDGHRRYGICQKLGLPYPAPQEIDLPDREAVKNWMDTYQGCRRNETDQERKLRVARMVAYAQSTGKSLGKAIREVAEKEQISNRTARRDVEFAANLEKVEPSVREKIQANEIKASQKDVQALVNLTPEHQKAVTSMVESGAYRSLAKALHGDDEPGDDQNSDTVSRSAKKPSKSADSYLDEAERLLGKLCSTIGKANDAGPKCKQYESCQRIVTNMAVVLNGWREEVQGAKA